MNILTNSPGMSVLFLHLSDIHLKEGRNNIFAKIAGIQGVVTGQQMSFEAGFLVLSGDIAYSGKAEEYEKATEFISTLRRSLSEVSEVKNWHIVTLPGNHDCDFEKDDETRRTLTESLLSNTKKNLDDAFLTNCLKPQKDFFKFAEKEIGHTYAKQSDYLANSVSFPVGDRIIVFNLYNTA